MADDDKKEDKGDLQPFSPEGNGGELAPLDPTKGGLAFWCNWDTKTEEGSALVTRCMGEPDLKPDKMIGETFAITGQFFHGVQVNDIEGGEVIQAIRAVLVLENGQTLAFVSDGALRSLRVITQLKGPGPWKAPLNLRLRQVQTRAGRRTYALELIAPALPGPKGGKK